MPEDTDDFVWNDNVTVADIVKHHRKALGLTQLQLAKRIGYGYGNFVAMIESPNSPHGIPTDKWQAFADALEVPKHLFLEAVLREAHPDMMEFLTCHPSKYAGRATRPEPPTVHTGERLIPRREGKIKL